MMTIKRRLVPFFAAGALVSSVAAHAQTASDPDSGSSAIGQAPGAQGMPAGNTYPGTTGNATPSAPALSPPDQSSSDPATMPGTSGAGTTTALQPQVNSPSSTDPSSTSMSPDPNSSKQ